MSGPLPPDWDRLLGGRQREWEALGNEGEEEEVVATPSRIQKAKVDKGTRSVTPVRTQPREENAIYRGSISQHYFRYVVSVSTEM